MIQSLQEINSLIEKLKNTNSSNDKKEILSQFDTPIIRKILNYTYNPFLKYWVTSDNLKKFEKTKFNKSDLNDVYETNLFNVLDTLEKREKTWYDAILAVLKIVYEYPEYKDLILMILDKDLKVWISEKIINTVYEWLIPEFNVSLATELSKVNKFKIDSSNKYFCSRKMDWVRVICLIDENSNAKFFSRAWNEFLTLDKIKQEIKEKQIKNIVLDWEVCIVDENWNENFQLVVWEIKKKDYTIENPIYKLFDILSINDFFWNYSNKTTSKRYEELTEFVKNKDFKYIEQLEQKLLSSEDELNEENKNALSNNWEWLILRKESAIYEWKRTKEMIKVKKMHDAEFIITWFELWKKPMILPWTNIMTEVDCLSSLIIDYKWFQVNVWSWFSNEDRLKLMKDWIDWKLEWKTITVQYFEETKNKDWTLSLRFPVFKWFRNYE